jgi:UDP-N-acetylmuramate dehydrogenase
VKIKENEKLSNYTTMGVGGPVPFLYLPESVEELCQLVRTLHDQKRNFRVIGNGSNLIVDDSGLSFDIICTKSLPRVLAIEGNILTADSGYPVPQLAYQSAAKNLSGLEFAVGIPATIGGVVRMNAGAHHHTISEIVDSVRMVTSKGDLVMLSNANLHFDYRYSAIPPDGITVEVNLRLTPDDSKLIHDRIRKYNEYRTSTQPQREKSAGCIFKNPELCAAGKLIQDSGLKGFQIGGAAVSEIHGNFIVNRQNATFEDIMKLIEHIKKTVKEKKDVELHEEVMIWRRE